MSRVERLEGGGGCFCFIQLEQALDWTCSNTGLIPKQNLFQNRTYSKQDLFKTEKKILNQKQASFKKKTLIKKQDFFKKKGT